MRVDDSYDPTNRSDTMPIDPPETIETDSPKVHCDGDGGALGHPRVYYDLHTTGAVDCGYCDRRFVWTGFKGATADKSSTA
jgi:uncharacterized Zn-finger protein